MSKRRNKRSAIAHLLNQRDQRASADAGQQNDEVDVAPSERIRKRQRIDVAFDRDFTQRRSGNGIPAVILDERRHFDAAATLKAEDAKPAKRRRYHVGLAANTKITKSTEKF
jgi:hypothetical protein